MLPAFGRALLQPGFANAVDAAQPFGVASAAISLQVGSATALSLLQPAAPPVLRLAL